MDARARARLACWVACGLAATVLLFPVRIVQAEQPGGAETRAREQAIQWLHSQQLPDGSFGQRLPNGQGTGDAGTTADVVYVLGLAGEDPGGSVWTVDGHNALDALARLTPDFAKADPGQAGKVARAVAVAGRDARSFGGLDLVRIIEDFYDPVTGRYQPDLLFRHTLAIEGLARAGVAVPDRAVDALWQAQRQDGGWFWAFQAEESDLDTTGRVLEVLAAYGGARCGPATSASIAYLTKQRDPAGGWGASNPAGPPNANSTAMAAGGLRALGLDIAKPDSLVPAGKRSPLEDLLAFQEPSGAFAYMLTPGKEESRLAATVDALTTLSWSGSVADDCRVTYLPVIVREGGS